MDFNTLSTTLNNFIVVFNNGFTNLIPSINWLIGAMLGIELILFGLWWALGGNDQLAKALKKILFIGFWLWLIANFPSLAQDFVNSLINAGLIAGGQGGNYSLMLDPSRIAGYGLDTTLIISNKLQSIKWDITDAIVFGISYIIIMLSFLIIAIQICLAWLEFYIVIAVSGIFMPFGFFGPTKFMAEKGLGSIVAAGVKLMVLSFIVAVTDPVLSGISFTGPDVQMNEVWSVLLTVGMIAFLAWQAPGLAAGLLSGSPSLSAGAAAQNAAAAAFMGGAAASGMVATTKAAASAGQSVASGATSVAGAAHTGYTRASAFTSGSEGAKMAAGVAGAVRSGAGSLAQSVMGSVYEPMKNKAVGSWQKGVSSSYRTTTGENPSMPEAPAWAQQVKAGLQQNKQGAGGSQGTPAWASRMTQAMHGIPQEARPSGGSGSPKL